MNYAIDLGGCYPPTLLNLQNPSYPTQRHSIIAKHYTLMLTGIVKVMLLSQTKDIGG